MKLGHLLSLIFLAVFHTHCDQNPKPVENKPGAELVENQPVEDYDCNDSPTSAFILGEQVRLREEPNLQGKVIGSLKNGELVNTLSISEATFIIGKDSVCDAYPFVEIVLQNDSKGWAYGKYVFMVQDDLPALDTLDSFRFENKEYRLASCYSLGMGASDGDGLTGCWEYHPVLLYDVKADQYELIEMKSPEFGVPNFNYWYLENDEGGADQIISIKTAPNGELVVSMVRELMEGCIWYQVAVRRVNDKLTGQYKITRKKETGCN